MRFGSAPRLLEHVDSKRVFFGLVIANLVGLLLALMLLVFLQRADGSLFIGYVATARLALNRAGNRPGLRCATVP